MTADAQVTFRRHTNAAYLCASVLLVLVHLPSSAPYQALEGLAAGPRAGLRAACRGLPDSPVSLVQAPSGPRDLATLGRAVQALRGAGASAIGLELPPAMVVDPQQAAPLAAALGGEPPVVLGLPLVRDGGEPRLPRVPDPLAGAVVLAYSAWDTTLLGDPLGVHLVGLTRNRALMGTPVELVRRHRALPSFNVIRRGRTLVFKPLPGQAGTPLEVTLDADGDQPTDRARGARLVRLDLEALAAGGIPPEALRGRVVVVDLSGDGRGARVAAATATLLAGPPLDRVPDPWVWGLLVLLGGLLTGIGFLREPPVAVRAALALTGLWWLLALGLELGPGLLLPALRPTGLALALAAAATLRHAYRPLVGLRRRTEDGEAGRQAQAALGLGIKLLQQGQVDESLKYFQKVARLESDLRGRSQYFLSLVLLRRGETETAVTLVDAMDFASLTRDDAYMLAEELERRGALDTAHTLFERLQSEQTGFRDVAARLVELKDRLSNVSEDELVERTVQKVVDRRFVDLTRLGRGGMGFVYRAQDSRAADRTVALKILSPFLANNEEIRVRFLREARLAAELDHPNIVRIYDVFDRSLPYYSMEYIGSLSVKEILAGVGHFPPLDAIELALQVCEGLGAAHAHGVVHRDVKPENLMLDEEAMVKVIDFGIAKVHDGSDLTGTRKRMGTPEYMSPEQVTAGPVDLRSDIYSFGIVLYELLTGAVPFREMRQHISDMVPPPDPSLALPEGLLAVLDQALDKNPDARYATMEEMKRDLLATRRELRGASVPPRAS